MCRFRHVIDIGGHIFIGDTVLIKKGKKSHLGCVYRKVELIRFGTKPTLEFVLKNQELGVLKCEEWGGLEPDWRFTLK